MDDLTPYSKADGVTIRIPATSNLYEPHLLYAGGHFWRCRHGRTGFSGQCLPCGLTHPFSFLRNWFADQMPSWLIDSLA